MWIDDKILKRCSEPIAIELWVPQELTIVLGSSNDPNTECHLAACQKDEIQILRRYGGGGAVLLHQGCLILTVGLWVRHHFQNSLYFGLLNEAVIRTLNGIDAPFAKLQQNGLSDLAYASPVGDKKIAGTSLFRSRNYLLYQASILVDSKVDLIEKYLTHPTKEPEYRKRRSHRDFLIGLSEIEPSLNPKKVHEIFTKNFKTSLSILKDELIAPQTSQFPTLLQRATQPRGEVLG